MSASPPIDLPTAPADPRTATARHIMVGLSGGVDSSVAALLLQQQGHHIEGMFMKNWEEDDDNGQCSAEQDFADVKSVCDVLGIHFHGRNFSAEYWEKVFDYFLSEYRAGRTPNPDILCNKEIKFKVFLEHALDLGAELIATGHYAQVDFHDGRYRLLKAIDHNKDQTYFLYTLTQERLSRTLFPLGHIDKPLVRRLAEQYHLPVYNKKDSTGICFIGERDFKAFLSRYLPAQTGVMRTPEGQRVGKHDGLMYYTLGQRQGLGIGGSREGSGEPWFVVAKDLANNELIVAQGHDHPLLYSQTVTVNDIHWISGQTPQLPLKCHAKTRYRQSDQACTLIEINNGVGKVVFDQPQRAVTPGQSLVFYHHNECLGGGIIQHSE